MKFHDWQGADADEDEDEDELYEAVAKLFVGHQHLLNGIFDKKIPKLSAEPVQLLRHYQCLSSGEYVMMKVALDIWCSSGGAQVSELLDVLDIHNFCNVLTALSSARGREIKAARDFKF